MKRFANNLRRKIRPSPRKRDTEQDKIPKAPSSKPNPFSVVSRGLKSTAGFLGLLTGSLSGITAITYALGFLVIRFHLRMLGLDMVSEIPGRVYLQQGWGFLYSCSIIILGDIQKIVVPAGAILIIAWCISNIIQFIKPAKKEAFRNKRKAFTGLTISQKKKIHMLLLVTILLFTYESCSQRFFTPITITDTLHSQKQKQSSPEKGLRPALLQKILENNRDYCTSYFAMLLDLTVLLALFLTAYWKIYTRSGLPRLGSVALVLLTVQELIFLMVLPLNYGVLMTSQSYPVIRVFPQKDTSFNIPGTYLFLINRNERDLTLWNHETKKTYVISSGDAVTIEVMGKTFIHSPENSLLK